MEEPSVSVPIINYRLQIAQTMGVDVKAVLAAADIDPKTLENLKGRISIDKEIDLWRALVSETGREDLGIICGLNFPIQSTGLTGYVMMNAPTIRVALKKICTYQKLIGDSMGMRVEEQKDKFIIYIDVWTPWREELRFTLDILMTACLSWSEKNTVNKPRPIEASIAYDKPENFKDYENTFSPAIMTFGSGESYLVYRKEDMNGAIISQNSEMLDFFETQVKEMYHAFKGHDTLTHKTKKLILQKLDGDVPTVEQIASELALSVRSLQKGLKDEGNSFQSLLNSTRKELAIEYLKKGIFNKSEIAFLLGFSELAVFSRSFKKWTGYSPSDYPTHLI